MEISLRKWQQGDEEALYELGKDAALRKAWNRAYLFPDTFAHAKTCIAFYRSADAERFFIYAILWEGHPCGWIQAERKDEQAVEISYWLGSNYQHRGIMHMAMMQLIAQVHRVWGNVMIYARVNRLNDASIKVLQQLSFQQEHLDAQTESFILRKHFE